LPDPCTHGKPNVFLSSYSANLRANGRVACGRFVYPQAIFMSFCSVFQPRMHFHANLLRMPLQNRTKRRIILHTLGIFSEAIV